MLKAPKWLSNRVQSHAKIQTSKSLRDYKSDELASLSHSGVMCVITIVNICVAKFKPDLNCKNC